MGQTGIVSLDISVPFILTRVYNDAEGTSSLTEEPIVVSQDIEVYTNLLARGVTGFLVAPRDPAATPQVREKLPATC